MQLQDQAREQTTKRLWDVLIQQLFGPLSTQLSDQLETPISIHYTWATN